MAIEQSTRGLISHPCENQPQCSTPSGACLFALPSVAHSLVGVVSEHCWVVQCRASEQPNHTRPVCRTASARSLGSAAVQPPENRRKEGLRNSQLRCGSAKGLKMRSVIDRLVRLSLPLKPSSQPLFLGEQDSPTSLGELTLVLALVLVQMQILQR